MTFALAGWVYSINGSIMYSPANHVPCNLTNTNSCTNTNNIINTNNR
jgi:hypothetical protein